MLRVISFLIITAFGAVFILSLIEGVKWVHYNQSIELSKDYEIRYDQGGIQIQESEHLMVFLFDDACSFKVLPDPPDSALFWMNANYFDKENQAIGLIISEGQRLSQPNRIGGCFSVRNGKVRVSSRCQTDSEFAAQSFLMGIRKGNLTSVSLRGEQTVPTYRHAIGQDDRGNVVIIASKHGAMVSAEQILQECLDFSVRDALLFDAGTSLIYEYQLPGFQGKFDALSDFATWALQKGKPKSYIVVAGCD
ncbi:MAG: phosphodiester glycosidase family protein [Bacteroidetes bacterium]|nr:phosphodiester glycosidase family protein [Bacteroidota bacterium]